MISMTYGTYPTAKRVQEIGVWDGSFYMDLKGLDDLVANIANLPSDFKTFDLKEFFHAVKAVVRVANLKESTIKRKIPNYLRNRYVYEDVVESANSLASGMMQVGVGVEWV